MVIEQEQPWHILHIDDDEDDHFLTRCLLEQAQGRTIRLDLATDLNTGREKLATNHYDAVLVDYDLGNGTGVELIREFVNRSYPAPLILYTGRGSYDIDVEAMHAGATLYLTKGEANALLLERSIRYAIERKQSEEAQRLSEHKLQIALDAAQLGTWVYHFDSDQMEMDERAQQLYQAPERVLSHEDVVQQRLHPDDIQTMRDHLKAASRPDGDGRYQIEYRIRQPDGGYCWLSVWGLVQFEGEGSDRHAVSLTGASRDITMQYQAEGALRDSEHELQASEARLRLAMSAANAGTWESDFKTGVDTWTPELFALLGLDPSQPVPNIAAYNTMVHPADRQRAAEVMKKTFETRAPSFSHQFRFIRPDGRIISVSSTGNIVYDEDGQPAYGYGINQDITELIQVEEALDESERRFRNMANHIPQLAWIADENGWIFWYNQRWFDFTGTTHEEMQGWGWQKVLHPEHVQRVVEKIRESFKTGAFWEDTFPLRGKDGQYRWFLARATPVRDENGKTVRWFGTNTDITEQLEVEKALRTSEERLREVNSLLQGITESTSDLIAAVDHHLCYVAVNSTYQREFKRIFGTNVMPGTSMIEALAHLPEDQKNAVELWSRALKGETVNVVSEFGDPGLERRIYDLRFYPIFDAEGNIVAAGEISNDITERVRNEKALRESEDRYSHLFNSHHTPMLLIDPQNGQIVNANPAACSFYGWTFDELTSKRIQEINTLSAEETRQEMERAQSADGSMVFHFRHRLANGEVRAVEVHSGSILVSQREFLFSIILDITERKQVEEALKESEERFRLIADTMPSLVWTAHEDGSIDYVNRQYEEYSGKRPEECTSWFDVPIYPPDRKRTLNAWRLSIQNGESFQVEHRFRRRDGAYRWYLTRGVPVRNSAGQIVKWCGTGSDIHDIKQAQEELVRRNEQLSALSSELKRSNQALVEFASIASHDLQEPLRKILAFGDRLSDTYGKQLGEHGQDYINRMQYAAERMTKMIQGLLDYSRVTTKARPFEQVDLNQVAREVLSDLEVSIQQTHGQIILGELPVIEADPLQMHQLMQNMFSNALKYHRPEAPPVVRVTARHATTSDGEWIQLVFEDEGIGFEDQYKERIFQPLQRLHPRSQFEGSGIGLAICAKIIERHNGKICASSMPGKGSTFSVDLPVKQAEEIKLGAD